MIGRPKRLPKAKNSDVTWCYNHRAGLTLFGSTAASTPNKLLNTPVGGFLHRVDAIARMLRLRPGVPLARSPAFDATDENMGRTQAVWTWRSLAFARLPGFSHLLRSARWRWRVRSRSPGRVPVAVAHGIQRYRQQQTIAALHAGRRQRRSHARQRRSAPRAARRASRAHARLRFHPRRHHALQRRAQFATPARAPGGRWPYAGQRKLPQLTNSFHRLRFGTQSISASSSAVTMT